MKKMNIKISDLAQETIDFCDSKFTWAVENIQNGNSFKEGSKEYNINKKKIESLFKEINDWFFENYKSHKKPYLTATYILSVLEHLRRKTNIFSYQNEDYYEIYCGEDVRNNFVKELCENEYIEDARLTANLRFQFDEVIFIRPLKINRIDSEVSARSLLNIYDILGKQTPITIYEDFFESTSRANFDDEALSLCVWLLNSFKENEITIKDKVIIRNIILSGWYNAAALSEPFPIDNEIDDWDENVLLNTDSDLYDLIDHHIHLLGPADLNIFLNTTINEYAPELEMTGYDFEKNQKIFFGIIAFFLITQNKIYSKKFLKQFFIELENENYNSTLLISILWIFYFTENQSNFEKLLIEIVHKFDQFDNADRNIFLNLPCSIHKSSQHIDDKYLIYYLIMNDDKFKSLSKNLNSKFLKCFLYAKNNKINEIFSECLKSNLTIDQLGDYSINWKQNEKLKKLLYNNTPKEILLELKKLEFSDQIDLVLRINKTKNFKLNENSYQNASKVDIIWFGYWSDFLGLIFKSNIKKPIQLLSDIFKKPKLFIFKRLISMPSHDEDKIFNVLYKFINLKTIIPYKVLIFSLAKKGHVSFETLYKFEKNKNFNIKEFHRLISYKLISWDYTKTFNKLIENEKFDILTDIFSINHKFNNRIIKNFLEYCKYSFQNENFAIPTKNKSVRNKISNLIKLSERSVNRQNAENLALFYEHGHFVEKNEDKKIEYLKTASQLGSGNSSLKLYHNDKISNEDKLKFLKLSLKQGNNDALYYLGRFFYYAKDLKTSQKYLKQFNKIILNENRHYSWKTSTANYLLRNNIEFLKNDSTVKEGIATNNWDIILGLIKFDKKKYLKDGYSIWDSLWLENYFQSTILNKNIEEKKAFQSIIGLFISNLYDENNIYFYKHYKTNETIESIVTLTNNYFDLLKRYDLNWLHEDHDIYAKQLPIIKNYKFTNLFKLNLNEFNDKEYSTICFQWILIVKHNLDLKIDQSLIESFIEKNDEILNDSGALYWLSFFYSGDNNLKSFEYAEKSLLLDFANTSSHNNLGLKYYSGKGCPKNIPLALAHFSIAKTLDEDNETYVSNYEFALKDATKNQIAKSEELALEMWEKIKVLQTNN